MHGIICIETEWQITTKQNRRSLNTEPIVYYMSEVLCIPVIYRRVATRSELQYYLKQFSKSEYSKYDMFYFNYHGWTHGLKLEGEKELLTLEDLAEMAGEKVFAGKLVHFSSCRTLLGSERVVNEFMEHTHAQLVTGYTKSVDCYTSSIFDMALFGEYISKKKIPYVFKYLDANFGEIEKKLGFKHFGG